MNNSFLRISLMPFCYLLMKSPYDGAQTSIYVAVADEEEGVSGKLYMLVVHIWDIEDRKAEGR